MVFCDTAPAGEGHRVEGITLHYWRVEGEVQASWGPSLTFQEGVLITLGWRWEYRVADNALGAASLLLGDGRRHSFLIHLFWHNLIAAGWGSKSRLSMDTIQEQVRRQDSQPGGGKKCQLSAWSSLIPHCGDAEILCSHEDGILSSLLSLFRSGLG